MRSLAVLLSVAIMLTAAPSFAHEGGKVSIEIIPEKGRDFYAIPFKDYLEGKTHIIKKYLEARKGENYGIVLKNNMPERVGVVVAVDGRNIISGKKSSLKNSERMYVLEPYGSARLDGWRTDEKTVHAFYFTDMRDSYSVRAFGDTSALGVIALAVFREKNRPMLYEHDSRKERASAPHAGRSADGSMKSHENSRPGTGFGDEVYSPVIKVEFDPEATPYEKAFVKYEWRDSLCRKGLLNCSHDQRNRLWDEDEYAPFPPG